MLNYNYFMKDKEMINKEIKDMIKEILIGDFYRKSKEWLMHNYDEDEWKHDLE